MTSDVDSMVAASLDTNAENQHGPQGATIAVERSQIWALVAQVRRHLGVITRVSLLNDS